jgi:hypothetical protein
MDGTVARRVRASRAMNVGRGALAPPQVGSYRADRAPTLALGDVPRTSSFYRVAAISGVLLLATALRVYGLARQSAWADEITTLRIADPSLPFLRFWDLVLGDTHPPLYYLLMRFWSAAFGQSDLAARLPSLVLGVAAVGAAAVSFNTLSFRLRMALMLLLAASPGGIEYAQEARSYSLLLFLSTVIAGACLSFIHSPGERHGEAVRAMAILTLAGVFASYTHYFGFLIAAAAGSIALANARGDRGRMVAAAVGLATTIAVFVPWVLYHLHYMSYGTRMSAWIGEFPTSATISWFVRLWLGGKAALLGGVAIAAALLSLPGFRAFARGEAACWLGPALAFVVVAAALAISWHTPVLTSRNLIVLLPALYLTIASLFDYAAVRWGMPAAALGLIAQLLLMTEPLPWYYTATTKEQWRESAAFVLAQPGCSEGPIYVYGETPNYRYLVEKARPSLKLIEMPVDDFTGLSHRRPTGDCGVLVWAADLSAAQFDAVVSALSIDRSCLHVAAFYWAFVAWRDRADGEANDCSLRS